jgi:hypothetical protein
MCEFARGEQLEDAWRSGRFLDFLISRFLDFSISRFLDFSISWFLDFICYAKNQTVLQEMPNASVRRLAEISHYSPSFVFYDITFVLRLKLRHWKWISYFLSDDDNKKWMSMTKSLEISLVRVQRRNWQNIWTGNESWIIWDEFPTGSWSWDNQEIPQRIRQTIGAKHGCWPFFSPVRFPIIDVMP